MVAVIAELRDDSSQVGGFSCKMIQFFMVKNINFNDRCPHIECRESLVIS